MPCGVSTTKPPYSTSIGQSRVRTDGDVDRAGRSRRHVYAGCAKCDCRGRVKQGNGLIERQALGAGRERSRMGQIECDARGAAILDRQRPRLRTGLAFAERQLAGRDVDVRGDRVVDVEQAGTLPVAAVEEARDLALLRPIVGSAEFCSLARTAAGEIPGAPWSNNATAPAT